MRCRTELWIRCIMSLVLIVAEVENFSHTGINQITYMQIPQCITFMQRKSNVIGTKLQAHPPSSVNATPCVNALLRQTHNRKCALSARGVSVKVQHCALSTFNYTAQHTGSPLL